MSQHVCPVAGCTALVPSSKLLCIRHWRRVSYATGRELYAAYREKPRSDRHVAAMKAAIKEAEGNAS